MWKSRDCQTDCCRWIVCSSKDDVLLIKQWPVTARVLGWPGNLQNPANPWWQCGCGEALENRKVWCWWKLCGKLCDLLLKSFKMRPPGWKIVRFLNFYINTVMNDAMENGEGKQAPSSWQTSEKTTYLNAHLARGGIATLWQWRHPFFHPFD